MEAPKSQIPDGFFPETFSGSELGSSGLRFTVHIKARCGKWGSRPSGDIKFVKTLKKVSKRVKESGKHDWTDKELLRSSEHGITMRKTALYSQSMSTGGALFT